MKIKRYKKVHRTLRFYETSFGFRKPYQVLIDGTLCAAALRHKINIGEQFAKYLDGEVKLLTTQCIVLETESLGPALFGACVIVKQFGVHACGHGRQPVAGARCVASMLGADNAARYIVATQDRELQQHCRRSPGVPLLYLHMTTPTLEQPSGPSLAAAALRANTTMSQLDVARLDALGGSSPPSEDPPRRKRKRKGGPNPLSCKKKKKTADGQAPPQTQPGTKKKARSRHKNRLVKRIKTDMNIQS